MGASYCRRGVRRDYESLFIDHDIMNRIKVVFILNNFLLGGAERVLLDLVNGLNKERFEIFVVTVMGGGVLESEFRKSGAKIIFMGPKGYPSSLLSKVLWLTSLPFIIIRLALFLGKSKPNLIVNSMYKADIITYLTLTKTKTISIQHDVVCLSPIVAYLKRKALKKTDKVIAISTHVKEFLEDYFKVDSEKIEVIYNGIDVDRFSSFNKSEWGPSFGTVARLDKIKGHIHILKVLKRMKDEGIDPLKFIFVGDGPEKEKILSFIKENDLNNVIMAGEKVEVGKYLKEIDVFVLPSLSEGLGISIIEALVAGKLVIASDVGGIKELVQNKKTGILFEAGNEEELYQSIKWVMENRKEVIEMKEASLKWINEKRELFDMKRICQRYSRLFEELVNKEKT